MTKLCGMNAVEKITQDMKEEISRLATQNITPTLCVVRVGAREDDLSYERGIKKRFAAAGAKVQIRELPQEVTQEALEETLQALDKDNDIHGIMMFRPLPKTPDESRVRNQISPNKDVDCMTDVNLSRLFAGNQTGFAPCTPQAVMELLSFYNIDVTGKRCVVVGRSMVVGRPLAMLLLQKNATVTICHTKTVNLSEECRRADILFACAGSAGMITEAFTHEKQVIIDVGINVADGKLCGDVSKQACEKALAYTPVPGGVGTVTTSVLLKNTVTAAKYSKAQK